MSDGKNIKKTSMINYLIKLKLLEYCEYVFEIYGEKNYKNKIANKKNSISSEIFNILYIYLGEPLLPSSTFTWSYTDKDGEKSSLDMNPIDFLNKHININSIHCYKATATVKMGPDRTLLTSFNKQLSEYDGNYISSKRYGIRNMPIEKLKHLIIKNIDKKIPVIITCNFSRMDYGLTNKIKNYELMNNLFNINFKQPPRHINYLTGNIDSEHLMVIIGYSIKSDNVEEKILPRNENNEIDFDTFSISVINSWYNESNSPDINEYDDNWINNNLYSIIL
jgi:aminopeptidase C